MSYHGMLPFSIARPASLKLYMTHSLLHCARVFKLRARYSNTLTHTHTRAILFLTSMGIVGVNNTAGREVKFIDPGKIT